MIDSPNPLTEEQAVWFADCHNSNRYKGCVGHTHCTYAFGGAFSTSEVVGEKRAYESFYEARDAGATRIALFALRNVRTGNRLKRPKLLKSLFSEETS